MKFLLVIMLFFTCVFSAEIDIEIFGIKNKRGKVYIGVYNQKDTFTLFEKSYKSKIADVNSSVLKVRFENISNGMYAVSLFHDENSNKVLDKSFLGIPKEGYGLSNNPKAFKKPIFDDAKFELNGFKSLKIEMVY